MTINNQTYEANLFGEGMVDRNERFSKIKINHIPMMITDKGKLLCIPQTKEMSHVGFTAMTSRGKGMGGLNFLCWEHWLSKRPCIILNDFQSETHENSLACRNNIFNNNRKIINSYPIGLPIVYVYPSYSELQINPTQSLFPKITMTLPAKLIIRNIEYFYKLERAGKYITANREKFEECGDVASIIRLLDEIIPTTGREKAMEGMKIKIRTIFENIFNEKLTGSSTPERPDKLTIKKHGKVIYSFKESSEDEEDYIHGMTLQALMAAGFIPSIQTSEIRGKPWFSAYMAIILESIYKSKSRDDFFKDRDITLYAPEIDKMSQSAENSDKGVKTKEKISLMGTNGRSWRIRIVWDAQNYSKVPEPLTSNTRTLFIGRKANAEEVHELKRDWNISKELESAILSLESSPEKGLFEFVAVTADKFALYDLKNGSLTWTSDPQKGILLPPLCQTKQPGRPLTEVLSQAVNAVTEKLALGNIRQFKPKSEAWKNARRKSMLENNPMKNPETVTKRINTLKANVLEPANLQ